MKLKDAALLWKSRINRIKKDWLKIPYYKASRLGMLKCKSKELKCCAVKEISMSRQWKEVRTQTLSAEEIERLLQADFGEKVQPVDTVKFEKLKRQRALYRK